MCWVLMVPLLACASGYQRRDFDPRKASCEVELHHWWNSGKAQIQGGWAYVGRPDMAEFDVRVEGDSFVHTNIWGDHEVARMLNETTLELPQAHTLQGHLHTPGLVHVQNLTEYSITDSKESRGVSEVHPPGCLIYVHRRVVCGLDVERPTRGASSFHEPDNGISSVRKIGSVERDDPNRGTPR